jgi:hypothetical protein
MKDRELRECRSGSKERKRVDVGRGKERAEIRRESGCREREKESESKERAWI